MPKKTLTKEQKAEVKEAFELFDTDGSGNSRDKNHWRHHTLTCILSQA